MWESIKRHFIIRKAKRTFQEYPTREDIFPIEGFGKIKFANWQNPLVKEKTIENAHIVFFNKFVSKGDTVIDIGANVGHMTIPMALAAGKNGLCLAFDPNPIVFKILSQNATLNPELTNIIPYNVAISDTESSFYYHSSEASFNNGGISPTKESRHGKYVLPDKIKGINLETLLQDKHPDYAQKLKLIKIDTEGYDKEIAKSIKSILVTCKPTLISECFGKMPSTDKYEYFDFLTGLGYNLYYFSDFVSDAEIIKIHKKEDMLIWKHFDFYAIHSTHK